MATFCLAFEIEDEELSDVILDRLTEGLRFPCDDRWVEDVRNLIIFEIVADLDEVAEAVRRGIDPVADTALIGTFDLPAIRGIGRTLARWTPLGGINVPR